MRIILSGHRLEVLVEREKGNADVACALSARLAASVAGIVASEMVARHGSRRISTARQIAMYLAHTAAGLPLSIVAAYFGRDRTTAAHACRLVEDRRDNKKFDAELSEIEDLLRATCGAGR